MEQKLNFYQKYAERFPRCDVPRKQPLEFIEDEAAFRALIDKYMQRAIRKGVPPLFKELKHLFKRSSCVGEMKLRVVEQLALGYVANLSKSNRFDDTSAASTSSTSDKETPTSLLWTYYLLAQLYDFKNETSNSLTYINKALEHTPTLVELYMVKGKIYKHCGNLYEAVRCLDEAQSLDTADRYVNYKCSKYMLRANLIKESQDIAAKFTRVSFGQEEQGYTE